MVKTVNIGKVKFTFVFRHKWEKQEGRYNREFRDYRLGFWFRRNKVVGKKGFSNPKEWNKNLVNDYMFGINLVVCKAWMCFSSGGMVFREKI